MFANISQLKCMTCLHLHVYGNNLNKNDIIAILRQVRQMKLSKFLFSFMEFLIQDVDTIDLDVIEAFETLDVPDKTIC